MKQHSKRFGLPPDSMLHLHLDSQSITETPESYSLATALATLGAPLKRGCWIDQVEWRVFPNLSVLLVGPSGIGKDTAIAATRRLVRDHYASLICAGKTMEMVQEDLLTKGDPASGIIYAPELTAFLGGKDYQKSMVQELTDLLSTGDYVDVSTKSHFKDTGFKRTIPHPTITMIAGSTLKWLHEAMPKGSLEGGFIPRLLVVVEEECRQMVPWPKYSNSREDVKESRDNKSLYVECYQDVVARFSTAGEIHPLPDAIDFYTHWYLHRFEYFPASVRDYANRSRDQMLRLAMLCAVSRNHNFIEVADLEFAKQFLQGIALRIDRIANQPTTENTCADIILNMLPCNNGDIYKSLRLRYTKKVIDEAMQTLVAADQIKMSRHSHMWEMNIK